MKAWLTIAAYATKYNVHRNTVRKWLVSGYLITYRQGRLIRIQDTPPQTEPSPSGKR